MSIKLDSIVLNNYDNKAIIKLSKLNSYKSVLDTIVDINSVNELSLLNLDKEYVCMSLDTSSIFLYRLSNNTIYRVPTEFVNEFSNIEIYVISYNVKDILKYFHTNGIDIKYFWDCYIASKVLDENIEDTSLNGLYYLYINDNDILDIEKIYKLYVFQKNEFYKDENEGLRNVYFNIELPCIRVVASMELNGIKIDKDYLLSIINDYSNSGNVYIYTKLCSILKNLDDNNYIHSNIDQYAAVTGRMYTREPNLQNIPNNKIIRDIFIPNDGNMFISFDYSQQEIRILSELCNDPKMISIFSNNKDIYSEVASLLFNLPYENCLKSSSNDMRDVAKRILLSIVYGISYSSLANQLHCSIDDVKILKNKIFDEFKNIRVFENSVIHEVLSTNYVQTLFGRRRRFSENISNREYRQAINSKIQGTGSDILKLVLIELYNNKDLRKLDVNILLPLHDEILFECPSNNILQAKEIIRKVMEESVLKYLHMPMKCDIKYFKKWGTPLTEVY